MWNVGEKQHESARGLLVKRKGAGDWKGEEREVNGGGNGPSATCTFEYAMMKSVILFN